ncbi:MAG TPA: hypothetical protein PLZ08_09845 [Bacillota bacterium]|jgi:hypothetical protein|nr:hypothetical protein [Bacillota bacterium]HOL10784.1 hypothetical protein [Bacillota bacterium]HPO98240.1 hypothetical protein [Bacillota bacterium]
MSISQVENVVGKAHFQTGSGFLKDAYNNYGPGLDVLRFAKDIYKDGNVKIMILK